MYFHPKNSIVFVAIERSLLGIELELQKKMIKILQLPVSKRLLFWLKASVGSKSYPSEKS